jgi:hypothetical protein
MKGHWVAAGFAPKRHMSKPVPMCARKPEPAGYQTTTPPPMNDLPMLTESVIHGILMFYLVVSAGRIVFYWPQISAILKCPNRASSSSILSQCYFSMAFWVSTLYFCTVKPDLWAGLVAAGNAMASTFTTACIIWKRQSKHLQEKSNLCFESDQRSK